MSSSIATGSLVPPLAVLALVAAGCGGESATPCTSSRECPGLVCNTALRVCVECVVDVDCPTGQTCDTSAGACEDPPAPCVSDRECTDQVCDTVRSRCVDCLRDVDCGGLSCVADRCVARDSGPGGFDAGPGGFDAGPGGFDAGPGGFDAGPGGSDAGSPTGLLYANSSNTLYWFRASPPTLGVIGPFVDSVGAPITFTVIDLAVDASGTIFVTGNNDSLYRVDPGTATVNLVGPLTRGAFALTFLPPSESASGFETLVSLDRDGGYHQLGPTTATDVLLGDLPDDWEPSGDLVSVHGVGTYVTLQRDDVTADQLGRLDFTGGGVVLTVIGPITTAAGTPVISAFGLAYAAGDLYAFTELGQIYRVNTITAQATLVTTTTVSSQFWGAGNDPIP